MTENERRIKEAMAKMMASKKTSHPWKREEPHLQAYYAFNEEANAWKPASSVSPTSASPSPAIRLITWNIDMLMPGEAPRMKAALHYLQSLVSAIPGPLVIMLQEIVDEDLAQIKEAPWIRERFYLTDIDSENWESSFYGTLTLVDERLSIRDPGGVFRVHYSATKFERDGLFVDVEVGGHGSGQQKILRLCNTHLESLVADPPRRPDQVKSTAKVLRDETIHAGVLAGDCNAIQPFDRTLHSENGLKDAYLELGGEEDSDLGYTWGQQVEPELREKFGCSRMDKILFCGGVKVENLERVGVGIEVFDEDREELRRMNATEWVTDHLGLMADLVILDEDEAKKGSKI